MKSSFLLLLLLVAISFSTEALVKADPDTSGFDFCKAAEQPVKKLTCKQLADKFIAEREKFLTSGECPNKDSVMYKIYAGVIPNKDNTDCAGGYMFCNMEYKNSFEIEDCKDKSYQRIGVMVDGGQNWYCFNYIGSETFPCVDGIRICPDGETSYPIETTRSNYDPTDPKYKEDLYNTTLKCNEDCTVEIANPWRLG